ncbi:uncharacterized protein LOC124363533 [Homalodisca vitripennis]|uniref:uncharacterized protein LOC124363533 n=1 Tax=Homalodisca vitripennis TaxID=197043 RepID=UPI001EEAA81C|nr:uncharacterized protein LOC124363533 [Homalodisca vitripennis]
MFRYRWQCTHNECPRYYNPKPQPGCFWEEELKSCCPSRMVCKNNLAKCVYNGVTYKENNRFYTFRGASCLKCLCTPSFNGTLMEPWCTKIGCDLELHGGEHLAKGCAPIYSKNFCCPIDWRCPDPEDAVRQADPRGIATSEGAGQCKFGDLMLNVGESVLPDLEANCKCNIPPYVVCTSS